MKLWSAWGSLLSIAAVALVAGPALGQTVSSTVELLKTYDEDIDVDYENNVDVDIAKDIDVSKDIDYNGVVNITGNINVSEAAMSTIDNKQITNDGVVDVSEADISNLAVVEGTALVLSGGNLGVNIAVGDNLLQENVAVLSAIGAGSAAGSAEAEIFSVQKTFNNDFTGTSSDVTNNTQLLGDVLAGAAGNIGVNAATGAYTGQKNALAIAAVTGDAALSEATAAVLQQATFNGTSHTNTNNSVSLGGNVANAANGNIGLNLSAGTNNQQQNSLAISSVQ
ncbi:MAG: hypothetical protein MI920_15970 [Kiloniellales bacterium]|nr:hypothetical protein [Kiloniellales bacterium]